MKIEVTKRGHNNPIETGLGQMFCITSIECMF